MLAMLTTIRLFLDGTGTRPLVVHSLVIAIVDEPIVDGGRSSACGKEENEIIVKVDINGVHPSSVDHPLGGERWFRITNVVEM